MHDIITPFDGGVLDSRRYRPKVATPRQLLLVSYITRLDLRTCCSLNALTNFWSFGVFSGTRRLTPLLLLLLNDISGKLLSRQRY